MTQLLRVLFFALGSMRVMRNCVCGERPDALGHDEEVGVLGVDVFRQTFLDCSAHTGDVEESEANAAIGLGGENERVR